MYLYLKGSHQTSREGSIPVTWEGVGTGALILEPVKIVGVFPLQH